MMDDTDLFANMLLYGNVATEVVHRLRNRRSCTTRCGLSIFRPFPGLPLLHVSTGRLYFKPVGRRMAIIPWTLCRRCWPPESEKD